MTSTTIETGDLEAWAARCHSLAAACRQVAVQVADGTAAVEFERVADALDALENRIVEVGRLLPEVDG